MSLDMFIANFKTVYNIYQESQGLKIAFLVILIVLIYSCRSLIVNAVVGIFKKIFVRHKLDKYDNSAINSLKIPLKLLVSTLLIYVAIVSILDLDAPMIFLLNKIVKSLVAVSVFWALYRLDEFVMHLFYKGYSKISENGNDLLIPFFRNIYKILIVVFGIIVAVGDWYDIGVIITGLGISGLAFALAAKDTAANLFGSVMIILEKTFNIGDYIQTKHGEGIVEDIGFRSTKLRTNSNTLLIIPNSLLGSEEIINNSKRNNTNVTFTLDITSNLTTKQLEELINNIKAVLNDQKNIAKETFVVTLSKINQASANIQISYFINTTTNSEATATLEKVNFEIKKLLETM